MGKFSSYTIELKGNAADVDEAKELILDALEDYCSEIDENRILVQEEYEFVWADVITKELAVPLAEEMPEVEFTISGTVDTSESAGEYMDFLIEYESRKLTVRTSDWYWLVYAENYSSYKEFCDEINDKKGKTLYTEEQYRQFKNDRVWVAIERDGWNEVLQKAPLSEPVDVTLG